jgi:TolB-like protein/DNA-binding winged helix-turn-helix (wHTH) protein
MTDSDAIPAEARVINGVAIDLAGETLSTRDGTLVALRPKAFAMLRHLVSNPNRLVTKRELVEAIWRGLAVTDDSIVQCVREIRRALDDEGHAILRTVPTLGYRIVLPEAPAQASPPVPTLDVLPFRTPGEPAADRFADGLVEDLTISLSRIRGLSVVARGASGTGDAGQTAARYLVSGSVRRSGSRLRITAELVEAASGAQVWAGRFDGAARDVFDLQDRLVDRIVGGIEPSIRRAEIDRAQRKRPGSLDAYDLCLRAVPHALSNTATGAAAALALLDAALALDPDHLPAHGYAAWCREQRYLRQGFDPADRAAALAHADRALGVLSDDPQVIGIAAFVRANLTRDYDAAIDALDRALAMNGSSALVLGFSALVAAHSERYTRAVEHAGRALGLSPPDDPMNYHPYCALAVAHLFAGVHAEAARFAALTIRSNPGFSMAHAYLVASLVNLGDLDAARTAARRLLEVAPDFTVADFARMDLFRPALTAALAQALATAGLPPGDGERSATG